jgi:hypothetical protein
MLLQISKKIQEKSIIYTILSKKDGRLVHLREITGFSFLSDPLV